MIIFRVAIIMLVAGWSTAIPGRPETYFDKLIDDFPGYLATNNLDPSPPYPKPITVDIGDKDWRLTAQISDYRARNLSKQQFKDYYRNVNLDEGFILLEYYITATGFSLEGKYTANGTMQNYTTKKIYTVQGNGNWKAFRPDRDFYITIEYRNISISNSGFANLKDANIIGFMQFAGSQYEMTGLSAEGNEEGTKNRIMNEMLSRQSDSADMNVPVLAQLHEYLVKSFASKRVADM